MLNFRRYKGEHKEFYLFFKNTLGFTPRNIELYQIAFIHKSKSIEMGKGHRVNNERLEYLGDAILSAVVADYMFRIFPTKPEGFLTEMRSRIVSRASLNKLSEKLGFGAYIRHTPDVGNNAHSMGGNAFEALMGAIYLDRGFDFAKHIIIDRIVKVHIDLDELQNTDVNFKSKLLEWSQKEKHRLVFKLIENRNNGHNKLYHVVVVIDDKEYATGADYAIKGAEQLAAEKTWNMLVEQQIVKTEKP